SQDQLERGSEKTDGVVARNRIAVLLYEDVLPFADRKISFDRLELRNRGQNGIGPYQIADLNLCNPGNSIHQRRDFRPLQVEFGLLDSRFVRFDEGLCAEFGLN